MKMKTDNKAIYTPADKLTLPDALLLQEVEKVLAEKQAVMLKATGNSMLPFLVGGRDSVLIQALPESGSLRVGQIALAHLASDRYVLHRIIRISPTGIILMGDGNLRETENCRLSDIAGVVTKIIRNGRHVDCEARLECYKVKVWGKLLPLRRYLLYIYKRLWKPSRIQKT